MIGINTMVQSKNKAGEIKCPGRVVMLVEADYFMEKMCHPGMDPDPIWRVKFPEWKSKPVVIVDFLEPHRTATFWEWKTQACNKGIGHDWSDEEWCQDYEEHCPVRREMCFPIDDLEEVDCED